MARIREVAAAHARAIRPQLMVAQDLIMLDRAEEALATLEAIRPDKAGADGFADQADQLNWWWDAKARAYALLGRYGDAVLAYSQGKAIAEGTFPNISQTINMSGLQLRFEHPADALITLAPIAAGKVSGSPYGLMQFRKNHGCASFRTGAFDAAKADLAYMTEHVADAPAALTSLQLCMGDVPAAAASTIRRLDRPDERVEALIDLSDYTEPPPTYPKDPNAAALAALKARADVQAAIARAGGTRKFNIAP